MRRKETAIEVKVGGLVLLAIGILVAFVLVLGDISFKNSFTVYVDFDNAAGLKPGAPVRISGIPAGTVRSVRFMGGEVDEDIGRPVYVRAALAVDEELRDSVRGDAEFTITTQGVLGEPYVEVTSTDPTAAAVEDGQIFRGVDPPRMDQLLTSAYGGLEGLRELVDRLNRRGENPIRIDDFINNIADLAGNIDERVVENAEEIDSIIEGVDTTVQQIASNSDTIPDILTNTETATAEFAELGASLNRGVGDGSSVRRIVNNVEEVTAVARREVDPLLTSIRGAAESADRMLTENEEQVGEIIDNVDVITSDLTTASADVATIVGRVEAGEGNLGRLLQDEEIFEDLREFVRELKRRPWRIIWKE